MNRKSIAKSLIPFGLYFGVEAFFGPLWGMMAGLSLCVFDLLKAYFRGKAIDRGSLIDALLILIFGIIAFLTEREGLKSFATVIFSSLFSLILAVSVWSRFNLLTMMGGSIMRALNDDPFRNILLIKSMKRMLFWSIAFTLFSSLLLLHSSNSGVEWLNRHAVWAFVSGFLAFELIWSRLRNRAFRKEEWLPLVDPDGRVIGNAPRSFFHGGRKWLHPVIHLHVITPKGLLLQKRPAHKLIQPNKWDTATGGHVAVGEKLEQALQRESHEEIGIMNFEARLLKQYIWESEIERELVFTFLTHHPGPFKAGEPEVAQVKEWSKADVISASGQDIFTPNLEMELQWILPQLP